MNIVRLLILFILIVTVANASIFNNIQNERYIDIGKTIGFSEIETPSVRIPIEPLYKNIAKTIIKKARNVISESCIVDENGNENCPIGEVECSSSITYGQTHIQTHIGKVVDYVKSINMVDDFENNVLNGWNIFNAYNYEKDGLRPTAQARLWIFPIVGDISQFPSKVPQFVGRPSYVPKPEETGWFKIFDFGIENANRSVNISYDILPYGSYDENEEVKIFLNGKLADEVFSRYGVPCGKSYYIGLRRDIMFKNKKNYWAGNYFKYPEECFMYKDNMQQKIFHREYKINLDNHGKLAVDMFTNLNERVANESFSFDNFTITGDALSGYIYNKELNKFTKEIEYKYYSFSCNDGYQLSDVGRKNCDKIDIDRNTYDETFLSMDCNVPSIKNCYKAESQCPLDSNQQCTYKGDTYNVFVPLKKFEFETAFYKPWEYGKTRGFDCTSSDQNYDCEFGINEIDASTDGTICFRDVHNYRNCISYIDESECQITGKLKRLNGKAIKSLNISADRKTLTIADNSNSLSDINISENFNTNANGWSNARIAKSNGILGSYLGKFGKGEFTQKKYSFGKKNANRVVNISFDFYRIDAWKDEKFNLTINNELFNVSRYSENDNEMATLVTPTDESTNAFSEAIFHRSHDVTLNQNGELIISFSSTLGKPNTNESFGIDNLKIVSASVSPGSITTNCMFYGKFGFHDVNLGTVAVYANKNRLTFWNSYNNNIVGFLDVLPKKAPLPNTNATTKFSFNSEKRVMVDEAINGFSKERILLDTGVAFGRGKEGSALILSRDTNSSAVINGGKDIAFSGMSSLEVSFDIKGNGFLKHSEVIVDNGTQISIFLNSNNTLSWKLNTQNGFTLQTTHSKINSGSWNKVSFVFEKSIVSIYINGIKEFWSVGSSVIGEDKTKLFIGKSILEQDKISASIDNITISNIVKNQEYYEQFSPEDADFYDYIREGSQEVKSLFDKGFTLLYTSEDKRTYMVNKDKISAGECFNKIAGTSFDIASPNANLSSFNNLNLVEVDKIIKGDCRNNLFNSCLSENNNTKCGQLSIMNCSHSVLGAKVINNNNNCDSNSSLVAREILKACDEKKLIEGISLQSQIFDNPENPYHCIIESETAIPFTTFNKTAIVKKVNNTEDMINTFVCSTNSCKNHICGYVKCPSDTFGDIGVTNDYTGCTSNNCDLSKPYYPTCGIAGACPEGLDIVNSSITSVPIINNKYHIELSGSGTSASLSVSKNSVLLNGSRVSNFTRGWNIITLNTDYSILNDRNFLVQSSAQQDDLKNYLALFEPSQIHIIAIKEDIGNITLDAEMKSIIEQSGLSLTKIQYFKKGDAYIYVGKINKTPIVEKYSNNLDPTLVSDFTLQKTQTQQKCYKITCPTGSMFDANSKSCFTIGCDKVSFLKDGKCISKIAK